VCGVDGFILGTGVRERTVTLSTCLSWAYMQDSVQLRGARTYTLKAVRTGIEGEGVNEIEGREGGREKEEGGGEGDVSGRGKQLSII
jgi:hypothetical protein